MTRITHTHYTFDIIFLRTNVDTNFEITPFIYEKMTFQHFHICTFLLPIVEYNFYVRNHHKKVEKVHDFPLKCHKMSYCARKNANFCIVRYRLLFVYITLLGVSLYFILDTVWCQFNMYIEDVFVHNSAILMLY